MDLLDTDARPGPPSPELPYYRTLLAVDIESFSARPSDMLPVLRDAQLTALREATRRAGLDWEEVLFPQVSGDGFVFGLPSERTPRLLDRLLPALQECLAEESARLPRRVGGIRLRAAVHLGPVPDDGVCTTMTEVHRLLDCRPLREALARTDPEVTFLTVVVSRRVVNDVVEAGYSLLRPGQLAPVRAQVKQFDQEAWLLVPKPSGLILGTGFAGPADAAPDPAGPAHAPAGGPTIINRIDGRITGSVTQGGVVNGGIAAHVTTASGTGTRPVPAAELAAATRRYTPPPAVRRARAPLCERHLVVVAGDPGDRRSAALWLLGGLADRDGIGVVDVVKDWSRPAVSGLPLARRSGGVVDLNDPAADRPGVAFAEDLLRHAARLAECGSYLVVTVRPELWAECWPVLPAVEATRHGPTAAAASVRLERLPARDAPPAPPPAAIGPVPGPPPGDGERAEDRHAEYLRLTDPEGRVSTYRLHDDMGAPRTVVTLGRPAPRTAPPDIVLDTDPLSWISRDHCRLERDDGHWWLVPRGDNRPLIHRRGDDEPEPVARRTRLRDGDRVHIPVRPRTDGRPRHWRIEFADPQETRSANGRTAHAPTPTTVPTTTTTTGPADSAGGEIH
ncbi:FHA domain-containing protein [Streptomyces sp. URMC 129]|uniref:FHA domain-containing protein n=1 Tax=Streptomyces sp. URMC 129 TaxID=3423407 RepID=UPI003F197908